MPGQQHIITLSIRQAGTSALRAFLFCASVDGNAVATNRSLTPAESEAVRDFSHQYNTLFEQPGAPSVALEELKALGAELFGLWLAGVWDQINSCVPRGSQRLLVIASDVPAVLNLPWELLLPPDEDFLGFDPRFSIRRLPWPDRSLVSLVGMLRPPPLRILFVACAPQDQPPLDYEREEDYLRRAIARISSQVVFDSGDLGTFEELRQRINGFQPHIVHLNGHGVVEDDGLGYFAFEDEWGKTDRRSSVEMGQRLFAGSGVQCVFVSGCQTGKAPPVAAVGGICQALVREEVPLALGWAASIADDLAIDFAATFYDTLASGQSADRALVQARHAIRRQCEESSDPSWTLPVLYSSTTQGLVFDPDPSRAPALPARQGMVQQPLPGMTEGYAEQFVGRRREIQRLLPALREGKLQLALITGLGGVGKSTLATRLARKLQTDGFTLIPVSGSDGAPLGVARLLQACGDAFLEAGMRQEFHTITDVQLAVDARLRFIVTALNRGRFLLVLDNFETNLDESSRCIADPELAAFYIHLLTHLSGNSRALITSRYVPAEGAILPRTMCEEALGDFAEATFLKFLLRDPIVERRYHAGELPHPLLLELYRQLGGTPGFLAQVREVLKTVPSDVLERDLSTLAWPSGTVESELQGTRQHFWERVFIARLFGYLSPEAQEALCLAAVYDLPVNMAGVAAVSGQPIERLKGIVREWHNYALAYPERELSTSDLWIVYAVLRSWLLAPERISPDARRDAHRAAGDFLWSLVKRRQVADLGLAVLETAVAARAQYLAAGEWETARRVTKPICSLLTLRGIYGEVIRLNLELLAHEEHPHPSSWLGKAYLNLGDYPTARVWYQRCLSAAGASAAATAHAWSGLASVDLETGAYTSARVNLEKALRIYQITGNRVAEAATWHQLGTADLRESNYDGAWQKCDLALSVRQEIGDLAGVAASLHQLGMVEFYRGHPQESRELFEKSMTITRRVGDLGGLANILSNLATIEVENGDYDSAHEKLQEVLAIHRDVESRAGEANTLNQLGILELRRGAAAAARALFQQSLDMRQELGDLAGEAVTRINLASIDVDAGEYHSASGHLGRSLRLSQQVRNRASEADAWHELGCLAAKLGRVEEGMGLVAVSFLIHKEIGHAHGDKARRTLAVMAAGLGKDTQWLDACLHDVVVAYQTDRGDDLLDKAFADH
jgi:tetratricopeptide (TPR) repeat protein